MQTLQKYNAWSGTPDWGAPPWDSDVAEEHRLFLERVSRLSFDDAEGWVNDFEYDADNALLYRLERGDRSHSSDRPCDLTAAYRGEAQFPCTCIEGKATRTWTDPATPGVQAIMQLDDDCSNIPHTEQLGDILALVPTSHRNHRLANLSPSPCCILSEKTQTKLIARLQELLVQDHPLRGVVLTGPPGTSKTTYASALMVEWATYLAINGFRFRDENGEGETWKPIVKIKVPQWLAATQTYDNRDFQDDRVPEPSPSLSDLERRPPVILVLEELDKFKPTEARLNYLFRLLDAAYEAEALILVTSNKTEAELREALGPAICRRIFGYQDEIKAYVHLDLHDALAKDKKVEKAKSVTR